MSPRAGEKSGWLLGLLSDRHRLRNLHLRLSIEERLSTCLTELDLKLVANEPHFRAPAAHRVTMEVFYCAIYGYFEEKQALQAAWKHIERKIAAYLADSPIWT